MSYLPYLKGCGESASIGVAIPGGKFLLVDNQNNIIQEPDVPGELIYEGENVSMGYAERIGVCLWGTKIMESCIPEMLLNLITKVLLYCRAPQEIR